MTDQLLVPRELLEQFIGKYSPPASAVNQLYELLAQPASEPKPVDLAVWYGPMPETNGKTNWTAILYRKGDLFSGITIDRSEYPDRVRYEADRMRFMIGELSEEPDILAYDSEQHSGYTHPAPAGVVKLPERMVKTARSSDEYDMCADHWNACLAAVAKLNNL